MDFFTFLLAAWKEIDDGWEFVAIVLVAHLIWKDHKAGNGLRKTLNEINTTLTIIKEKLK